MIANQRRAERRRTRLGARLAKTLQTEIATHEAPRGEAAEILRAMGELGAEDRELLMLVSWEDLAPSEAARVLGITALAARSRLHRARRRLKALVREREMAGAGEAACMEEAR